MYCVSQWLLYAARKTGDTRDDLTHIINSLVFVRHVLHHVISTSRRIAHLEKFFSVYPQHIENIVGGQICAYFSDSLLKFATGRENNPHTFLLHGEILSVLLVMFSTTLYHGIRRGEEQVLEEEYDGDDSSTSTASEEEESEELKSEEVKSEGNTPSSDVKPSVRVETPVEAEEQPREEETKEASVAERKFEDDGGMEADDEADDEDEGEGSDDEDDARSHNLFLEVIVRPEDSDGKQRLRKLLRVLLERIVDPCPNSVSTHWSESDDLNKSENGIFLSLTNWMFSLPSYAYRMVFGDDEVQAYIKEFEKNKRHNFQMRSALVLELMFFYRKVVLSPSDDVEVLPVLPLVAALQNVDDFTLLTGIFRHISATPHNIEEKIILSYILLIDNKPFLDFVLSHDDLASFLLPLLRILYSLRWDHEFHHHVQLIIVIFFVLTQHESFNVKMARVKIPQVLWYKEARLYDISLSSFIMIIFVRFIHWNICASKADVEDLNRYCYYALGNLSPYLDDIPVHACQRFLDLQRVLTKRKASSETSGEVEELLQSGLEILDSILSHRYSDNPHMIYQVLWDRELLEGIVDLFSSLPEAKNISKILEYFDDRLNPPLEAASVEDPPEEKEWSIDQIMVLIDDSIEAWKENFLGMEVLGQLHFQFNEKDDVEEFFLPFLWSVTILGTSSSYWEPELARLNLPVIEMQKDNRNTVEEEEKLRNSKKSTPRNRRRSVADVSSDDDEREVGEFFQGDIERMDLEFEPLEEKNGRKKREEDPESV